MNLKKIAFTVLATGNILLTANAACPSWSDSLGTREGKEACGLNDVQAYSGDLLLTSDKLWVLQ